MTGLARGLVLATVVVGWTLVTLLVATPTIYLPLAAYAAVAAMVVAYVDRDHLRGLFRPSIRGVGWGLAGAAVTIAATYPAFSIASALFPALARRVEADYAVTSIAGNWSMIPALAVIVLSEELIWRGAILRSFSPEHRWSLLALSVGTYTFAQLGFGSWTVALLALSFGIVWTGLRVVTGGLVAPLLTHLLWNIAVLIAQPVIS